MPTSEESQSHFSEMLTVVNTLIIWSTCHRLDGENLRLIIDKQLANTSSKSYRSIARNIFEVQSALNSCSQVPRNDNISLIIVRILLEFINAKHNSIARLQFPSKNIWSIYLLRISLPFNWYIGIFKTFDNGCSMSLNSIMIGMNNS